MSFRTTVICCVSTTDDLYLVHDRKVEPFDGDLEDYQQWLSDVQKQENQTDEAPKENANSAQARKDSEASGSGAACANPAAA